MSLSLATASAVGVPEQMILPQADNGNTVIKLGRLLVQQQGEITGTILCTVI